MYLHLLVKMILDFDFDALWDIMFQETLNKKKS